MNMEDFGSQQQAQGQAYAAMLAQQGRGGAQLMQQQPMGSSLNGSAGALAKGLGAYAAAQNKNNTVNPDPLGALIRQNNNWNNPAAPAMPAIPTTYGPQANFNAA
jgi:hypothetical protein